MKNKFFKFLLAIFYTLILFYVVMFVYTFIEEKNGDVVGSTNEVIEDNGYEEDEREDFEIHDDTKPSEIANEAGEEAKSLWGKITYKVGKFFTSKRDGRNIFEITNENIYNLFTGK